MTFHGFRVQLVMMSVLGGLLAAPLCGREAKGEAVLVCGDLRGLEGPEVVAGLGTAGQILRQAGIRLDWRSGSQACTKTGNGLIVSTSTGTPVSGNPWAMAAASVYEGKNIVVFVDRLKRTFAPDQVGVVLGHVLAHEIVHMLQGVDRHSEEGLMKARWRQEDYEGMRRKPMALPEEDVAFIRDGMKTRRSLVAGLR